MNRDSWAAPALGPEFTHQYVLDLIRWFETEFQVPTAGFQLNSILYVAGPEGFVRSLKATLAQGPSGPRAMYGAIQQDLQNLRRLFG
ncbi:hypothetical protein D3C87_656020 [compost metagenome]